jgi:hypothetical protein
LASKRRKPTHLPEPRGRRGHKSVEEQTGLREWLIERLQIKPRPTLNELLDELKKTGFSIGRTAVWEFRVAWEKHLAERDLALRQAQEYAALDNDQPLNVEAAVSMMGNIAILNDVQRRLDESAGVVSEEIQALLNLASRMQMSAAQRERTKNQIERGVVRAMNRIKGQMEELLKREPQALKIVIAAMRDAARKEIAQ